MRLMFTPSLSTPRNPDALPVPVARKPVLIMRKDGWGTLHMVQEELDGISLSYRGRKDQDAQGSALGGTMGTITGDAFLEALCGWSDSPELLEALATPWEPDNSFSIYY
jgi:hypothetical protein